MNKLLLYSLSLFFLGQATEITKREERFVSPKLDSAQLFKTNERFERLKDNEYFKIDDYKMHSILHNYDNIKNFEEYDSIEVSHPLHDEYKLMAKAQVCGSGVRGTDAKFWLSKFAVHIVAQVAYALVAGAASFIYPPAVPIVYCSLQLTFAAPVEIVSNIVAHRTTTSGYALGSL